MPTISQKKKDKISEQILHYLFTISPESKFTSEIAEEIARDEEFTKTLLIDLLSKKLISMITKNSNGINYIRRQRWALSKKAYEIYKNHTN
jgi:predicted transcriptional regulator with HTH domain